MLNIQDLCGLISANQLQPQAIKSVNQSGRVVSDEPDASVQSFSRFPAEKDKNVEVNKDETKTMNWSEKRRFVHFTDPIFETEKV